MTDKLLAALFVNYFEGGWSKLVTVPWGLSVAFAIHGVEVEPVR